jgi:hypothetical protein
VTKTLINKSSDFSSQHEKRLAVCLIQWFFVSNYSLCQKLNANATFWNHYRFDVSNGNFPATDSPSG